VDSLLIRLRLKSDNISMGHLLITGASFAGKSTLMELVSRFLFDQIRVFSTYVDCNEFKGMLFNRTNFC
jgi:ABC-type thiamine transport system ATPase subunit